MSAKKKNTPISVPENTKSTPPAVKNTVTPAPAAAMPPVKDFFDTYASKMPLVALCLLFIGVIIIFKDFIFFDKTYFFKDIGSDSINYTYPTLYHIANYMSKYGLPKWSFGMGMGQSAFPFMLRDPFDIFYFLAGKNSIQYGIIYKELAKIVLGGMVFFFYLKKLKLADYTAIAGSLFFAFSGFEILGSSWYLFTSEALILALYLLAFEHLLAGGKWYLFTIAVFLTSISQPFNLYIVGIFLIFYALFRLSQTGQLNVKTGGTLLGKMVGLGIVGILISGPFFLENILQLIESPRGGGAFSLANTLKATPMLQPAAIDELGTGILRFFSTDILGGGTDFRGWKNLLEAPMFYCGLPCLLLMPQVFGLLDKKMKITFGIFLSVWLIPVFFPYFRYAFWLFSGNYYRIFSFFVALVFIYYAALALDLIIKKRKINLINLIVTTIVLLILLNYPYFPESGMVNSAISAFAAVFLLGYASLLFFMGRQQNISNLKYIFLGMVFLEMVFMSTQLVNDRDAITKEDLDQRLSYNDYTNEAVAYIKQHDKSFYRIDKSYASSPAKHFSINDAMVQDYNGTSSYNSFNQEHYIKYLTLLGISDPRDETSSRWAMGFLRRIIPEAENDVKYILTKSINFPLWRAVCDSVTKFNDIIVLKSKYALPLGFTYNKYVKESVYSALSITQKDLLSLDATVVADADVPKCKNLTEFQLKDTVDASLFTPDLYAQRISVLKKDTMVLEQFGETSLKGKIILPEEKMMYLALPYDGGWKAFVDGKEQEKLILSAGMTGLLLPRGSHTIELSYNLRYFTKGIYMSIAGIVVLLAMLFIIKKKTPVQAEI